MENNLKAIDKEDKDDKEDMEAWLNYMQSQQASYTQS